MPSLRNGVLEEIQEEPRRDDDSNPVTPPHLNSFGQQYRQARLGCTQEREHALRTYDLEEGHFKMPVSVADVYNDHVKVKGRMGNLTQVRKLVRSVIFPKMKFVTNEATFSQPAHISEKSVQHDFLVGMNWHENNRVNEAKLRSPDCKLGGRSEWSEPLIVRAHECARKGKTVFQISAFWHKFGP